MSTIVCPRVRLYQAAVPVSTFKADVLRGLKAPFKELPCKYFYDEVGSQLFDQITELEEYYPTRTELAIMRRHVRDMAQLLGPDCLLIEYGSGSSIKTRQLLNCLNQPAAYMPIDISGQHLEHSAQRLAEEYARLEIVPVCADFTQPLELPPTSHVPRRRVIYFPGSTIGNFTPSEARRLLQQTAKLCGLGGGLLLGVDLKKNPRVLNEAYNDRRGVTAAFNRNILVRIDRELGADFAVDQFWHYAFYNPRHGRVEMHLVSQCDQEVHLGEEVIAITDGESIRTEYSYKYSPSELRQLGEAAGFCPKSSWMDERKYFCVQYLTVPE